MSLTFRYRKHAPVAVKKLKLRRFKLYPLIGIVKGQSLLEKLHVLFGQRFSLISYEVRLLDIIFGAREPVGHFTVICKDKKPGCMVIEPSDRT